MESFEQDAIPSMKAPIESSDRYSAPIRRQPVPCKSRRDQFPPKLVVGPIWDNGNSILRFRRAFAFVPFYNVADDVFVTRFSK